MGIEVSAMPLRLTFLGAAQNVTGSRFLLETGAERVLIDCGLYQERALRERNWAPFRVPPGALDAVLLTHAHLDHSGLLPKLVHDGFRKRVYCTPATAEIADLMLQDSAQVQEEDAEFKRKRHQLEGRAGPRPEVPLYTRQDALACKPLCAPVPYGQPVRLGSLEFSMHDAGHVLGSCMFRVVARVDGGQRTIIFSGDVGRWDKPILHDPTVFDQADYVLVESTYGDRLHADSQDLDQQLADAITSTARAGGNLLIPSFALERSQDILYRMKRLTQAGRIPKLMVFLDSPMATRITEVFQHHPELLDPEPRALIERGDSPFDFPGLKVVRTVDESKALNSLKGTAVIIAGSGMCTGGRIKHHLATNISRPESAVLFVGYQASDTLGRQLVDGAKEARILGQTYPVRARIMQISGFSAHADRDELVRWLSGLRSRPKRLFVTHGEPATARSFAEHVRGRMGWEVAVPGYGETAELV